MAVIIGLLIASSSFLSAEAIENDSNDQYNVPGRKLLNNYIGYGAIGKENQHRPRDLKLPPPANNYSRGCTKITRCDHSELVMDEKERKGKALNILP